MEAVALEDVNEACESGFSCINLCDPMLALGGVFCGLILAVGILDQGVELLEHLQPALCASIQKEFATLGVISFGLFTLSVCLRCV